jgi:SAM-dependent methyltransferase
MEWPFETYLLGMDHAESMVRAVWPGDVSGVRRAVVGDWREPGLPRDSQDVVIGDGGFVFFNPEGQRALMESMRRILRPGGLFVYRHYAQDDPREPLQRVLDDARAGRIGNFHVFKWRLAMALQRDTSEGVGQNEIWAAWNAAGIDPARLPQPGWSPRAVSTIEFYRGKNARLYFPTLAEFRTLLSTSFRGIEIYRPGYELGERCPFLSALA